jgi:hypothetical protein
MSIHCLKNQVNYNFIKGWKIIPHRAFSSTPPCLLVTLNPIPVIKRSDYVMYLVRMKKAYEIFPKEHHEYIDQIAYNWKKIADDWEELMEIFEDVNHPVRGERLTMKTRDQLFEESLNDKQKEALGAELQKLEEEEKDVEGFNKFIKEARENENKVLTLDEMRQDPDLQESPVAKYYIDKISGKDVPDKTVSDLENEDEMEIEDFYEQWKERLTNKN